MSYYTLYQLSFEENSMAVTGNIEVELKRPTSIADTGLGTGMISDLAIKSIYFSGELTGANLAQTLKLPYRGIVQPVLEFLDREELVGISGGSGTSERNFRYVLSRKGLDRVRDALSQNGYAGPAPVPLAVYNHAMRLQSLGGVRIQEETVKAAYEGLVINAAMFDKIGPALNSGRSVFLYGPPGNGKTTIAKGMARLLGRDPVYVPYAVEVDGQIIKVFDDFNHKRIEGKPSTAQLPDWMESADIGESQGFDERWVKIERPIVMVGGELNLESLDLIFNPVARYYEAPFQMKANGGMFLIDDFGRQRMDPQDLLNRWIVPLETRIDFLTLHTGKKIEIPFEQLVVFSTNLNPADLVDDAFLRRIRHKIRVGDPSLEEFKEVFKIVAQGRGVLWEEDGFTYLINEHYIKANRALKNSHPRDLLDQIIDLAKYKGIVPAMVPELLDQAAGSYFTVMG
jgi:energy-coupling factor transporter ATP-binding protein EcfA2